MRYQIAVIVSSVALAGVGCLPGFVREQPKPPQVEMKEAPAPVAVMPESVTEKNADEQARRLRQELEADMKRQAEAESEKPADPKQ